MENSPFPRPRILANFAISSEGKIRSVETGISSFSSKEDQKRLIAIRQKCDAILVGRKTFEEEKMTLKTPQNASLLRCVISRSGKIPLQHPLWKSEGGDIHLFVEKISSDLKKLQSQFLNLFIHQFSLQESLTFLLEKLGVSLLLCEGGGELFYSLCEISAVDEIFLTLCGHSLINNSQAPSLTGLSVPYLPQILEFELIDFNPNSNEECFLHYRKKNK